MTPVPRTLRHIDDRYEVLGTLGEGGMAIVMAAKDQKLARDVAIKFLRPQFASDPHVCERFAREAHAAASLSHPNIIEIYDVGVHDYTPYMVMRLIAGQTLKQIIATEAPFHPDDVASVMRQIGAALDYAHANGYVHRDVKPGNILVDPAGQAHVADFGIAKGIDESDSTQFEGGFGTAAYMAPEQALGQMATPATDIYSAGVIAFELLTGKLPFAAETFVAMAMRQVRDPPPPPSLVNPRISPALDAIVLKALDKNPTRRWSSMHDFAQALTTWDAQAGPRAPQRERRLPAPRSTSSLASVAVAILVMISTAALLWFGLRIENARSVQEQARSQSPPVIEISDEPRVDPLATAPATDDAQPTIAPPTAAAIAPTIAPIVASDMLAPDVRGLSIPDATRTLLEAGLRIAMTRSEFSDSTPMNSIIAQDPAPGAATETGSVVSVTLSRGPSPFPSNRPP